MVGGVKGWVGGWVDEWVGGYHVMDCRCGLCSAVDVDMRWAFDVFFYSRFGRQY